MESNTAEVEVTLHLGLSRSDRELCMHISKLLSERFPTTPETPSQYGVMKIPRLAFETYRAMIPASSRDPEEHGGPDLNYIGALISNTGQNFFWVRVKPENDGWASRWVMVLPEVT